MPYQNKTQWGYSFFEKPFAETISTIPAEGNYWGTDHGSPEPGGGLYHYSLDKVNFGGCGGFPEINLAFGTKASGAPTGCPAGPPTGPHVPPSKGCSGLMATPTEQLGGSFFGAFFAYQDKLEQEELTESTYSLFAAVAQKSNTERGTASDQCKHYIDVARVFVPHTGGGQNLQSAGGSPQGVQQRQSVGMSGQPALFPNPAAGRGDCRMGPRAAFLPAGHQCCRAGSMVGPAAIRCPPPARGRLGRRLVLPAFHYGRRAACPSA